MKEQTQPVQDPPRSSSGLVAAFLAAAAGLAVGWIDLHTTEVSVTIVALLVAGFLLGLFRPVSVWRWAVLIALGLPVMEGFAVATKLPTPEPVQFDIRIVMVALAFALAGAYGGAFCRHVFREKSG